MKKKVYVLGILLLSAGSLFSYQQLHLSSQHKKLIDNFISQSNIKRKEEQELLDKLNLLHEEVKHRFYYQQLSKIEQADYLRLLHGLRKFDKQIYLNNRNDLSQWRIFLALAYDHPEFYWLSETQYGIELWDVNYPENAKVIYDQLQVIGDEVIAKMPEGSEYEKVKYLYEYIINNTEYNAAALDSEALAWQNQSIRSVFLDKKSICNGYSLAFQFLCQKAGIESIYVAGGISSSDLAHAWNLVKIDGKYYAIDTTWGDPVFASLVGGDQAVLSTIDYTYLCMPKDLFEKTHLPWKTFYGIDGQNHTYPEIEGNALNYYQLYGGYFEAYHPDQIGTYLASKLQTDKVATIQIGSLEAFEAFTADLQANQVAYLHEHLQHLTTSSSYNYFWEPSSQTISFYLK